MVNMGATIDVRTTMAEVWDSNTHWLEQNAFDHDGLLAAPSADKRRCISLIADGRVEIDSSFRSFLRELHIHCPRGKWTTPTLHHTFMVVRGFKENDSIHDYSSSAIWEQLGIFLQENLPRYTVEFDTIFPTRSGIALCGQPTFDVNLVRQLLRDNGFITDEPYELNICHVTLLKWTAPLNPLEQDLLLDWVYAAHYHSVKPYITLHVERLLIAHASRLVHPNDVKIILKVPLR